LNIFEKERGERYVFVKKEAERNFDLPPPGAIGIVNSGDPKAQ